MKRILFTLAMLCIALDVFAQGRVLLQADSVVNFRKSKVFLSEDTLGKTGYALGVKVGGGVGWIPVSGSTFSKAVISFSVASNPTTGHFYSPVGFNQAGSSSDPTDTANAAMIYSWVAPYAGTLKNFVTQVSQAPQGTATITYTIIQNKTVTSLSSVLATSNTHNTDVTHSVVCAAGDLISVKVTVTGVPTNPFGTAGSLEFDSP